MWTDPPPSTKLRPDGTGDLITDPVPSATILAFIKAGLWLEFISGHIFLPILLLIFIFSRRVKRHFTLLNVLVVFIISSIIRCLLIWENQATGHRIWSTHNLTCAIQAGLQISIPPMWSAAVFALTFHTWKNVSTSSVAHLIPARTLDILLFSLPYAAFIVWIPSGMWWALMKTLPTRSLLTAFCVSGNDPNVIPMDVFSALLNLSTITLQLNLLFIYLRTRRSMPSASRTQMDRGSFLRILIFGLYTSTSPLVSLLQAFAPPTFILPRLYASTLGVAFLMIFGTRKDVFQVLMFWKRPASGSVRPNVTHTGTAITSQAPNRAHAAGVEGGRTFDEVHFKEKDAEIGIAE